MNAFKDYLLRVKHLSVGELMHRLRRLIWQTKFRQSALKCTPAIAVPSIDIRRLQGLELPSLIGEKKSACREEIEQKLSSLRTPLNGIVEFEKNHRKLFFSEVASKYKEIDIRSVWEPSRLQHCTWDLFCAEDYLAENERSKNISEVRRKVEFWIDQNPFLLGPHYMSPMECGLRIPVFLYTLKRNEHENPNTLRKIADTIYRHAWWISRNLSLYNSIGNHTICECIGLIFAGALYDYTREGKRWLSIGYRLLDQEIWNQVQPDGGPVEQSLSYHRFILDLFWLASSFLRINELHDCGKWSDRLETGEHFYQSFISENQDLPDIGDNDGGYAVAPGLSPERKSPSANCPKIQTFEDSGYTVIRDDNDLLMTFDHGPLGMAPLYNHGHADALSVTLMYRGEQVLADSGTYRYNEVPEWRRYFKGTRAHNTIAVDGLDQANQASGFIWTDPFRSTLLEKRTNGGAFVVEACHDGYCRLESAVRHYRKIMYWAPNTILIKDRFTGIGSHHFEMNYHLGGRPSIHSLRKFWQLGYESFFVYIRVLESIEGRVVCGETNPPFGWFSPAYGEKVPSNVLTYKHQGRSSDVVFTTSIIIRNR